MANKFRDMDRQKWNDDSFALIECSPLLTYKMAFGILRNTSEFSVTHVSKQYIVISKKFYNSWSKIERKPNFTLFNKTLTKYVTDKLVFSHETTKCLLKYTFNAAYKSKTVRRVEIWMLYTCVPLPAPGGPIKMAWVPWSDDEVGRPLFFTKFSAASASFFPFPGSNLTKRLPSQPPLATCMAAMLRGDSACCQRTYRDWRGTRGDSFSNHAPKVDYCGTLFKSIS